MESLREQAFKKFVKANDIRTILEKEAAGKVNIFRMGFESRSEFIHAILDWKLPCIPMQRKDIIDEEDQIQLVENYMNGKRYFLTLCSFDNDDTNGFLFTSDVFHWYERWAENRNEMWRIGRSIDMFTYLPIRLPKNITEKRLFSAVILDNFSSTHFQNKDIANFFFTEEDARVWIKHILTKKFDETIKNNPTYYGNFVLTLRINNQEVDVSRENLVQTLIDRTDLDERYDQKVIINSYVHTMKIMIRTTDYYEKFPFEDYPDVSPRGRSRSRSPRGRYQSRSPRGRSRSRSR